MSAKRFSTIVLLGVAAAGPLRAQAFADLDPGTMARVCQASDDCALGQVWYAEGDTLGLRVRGREVRVGFDDILRVEVPVNLGRLRRSGAKRGAFIGGSLGGALLFLPAAGYADSYWIVAAATGVGFVLGGGIGAFLGASVSVEDPNLEWVMIWARDPY
ncbi:MAG: hypothetical protein ACR2QM_04595 [Longimicrobiales bacterium]